MHEIGSKYIVTGNSNGSVVIYNRRIGIVKQFSELKSDCLSIVCTHDSIFATGIDSRVI